MLVLNKPLSARAGPATCMHVLLLLYRKLDRDGREFERRTPARNGNQSRDAPPSTAASRGGEGGGGGPASPSLTPAPSSTPTPTPIPTAAAARAHHHSRAGASPRLSRVGPTPLHGKSVRPRHRDEGVHHTPTSTPTSTSPTRSATPCAAGGGCDLFCRGGQGLDETADTPSATMTVLGSSEGSTRRSSSSSSTGTAATAATRGLAAVRYSPSSGGVYSPVDLRSAGKGGGGGALGLGSFPAGVALRVGEEAVGEGCDDSPARPRAFWREEWLRGSGGGVLGAGEGCGGLEGPGKARCRGIVAGDGGRSPKAPDERAPAGRGGMTRPGCCCRRKGSNFRDECCWRLSSSSGGGGGRSVRPRRSGSDDKSLFRDARVKRACCGGGGSGSSSGDADARADSSSGTTRCRGFSGVEAEQSRRDGDGEEQQQRAGTFVSANASGNNVLSLGGAKTNGAGSEGVSAVGYVFLTAVAVAAFAAGTLMGPPHRQQQQQPPPQPPPPSPPPASRAEFAPLLSSPQTYEPTLQQSLRTTRSEAGRGAAVISVEQASLVARGSQDGSRTDAVAEAAGREAGDVSGDEATVPTTAVATTSHSTAVRTPDGEEEGMLEEAAGAVEAAANERAQRCGEPLATGRLVRAPSGETAPPTGSCNPRAEEAATAVGEDLGRQHSSSFPADVETGRRSAPRTTAANSSPREAIRGAGASGRERGPMEANRVSRSTSPFSSPWAGAAAAVARAAAPSGARRPRRRTGGPAGRGKRGQPSSGASPAAFIETLKRAERSLAGLSASGSDEEAERATARRAAMSKSAAHSACELLAWQGNTEAALVAGDNPQDDDLACDDADADSAWKRSEGAVGIVGAFSAMSRDDRRTGGSGQVAEPRATLEGAAGGSSTQQVSSARGPGSGLANGDAVLMAAKETGHDGERSVAGYAGQGPSSSSPGTTTAEAVKARGAAAGASRDVLSKTDGGHGDGGSPPLGPRCRWLALLGDDVRASWAGRYVPVRVVDGGGDARRVLNAVIPPAQHVQSQTAYHYCRVPGLASGSSAASAVGAEGGERVLREGARERGEDRPPPPLRDFVGDGDRPIDGAFSERPEEAIAVAAVKNSPTRSSTAETKSENKSDSPATPAARETAAVGTAAVLTLALPTASTTGGTAAATGDDPGLQEVADGGVLCLYWADVGDGGRWVLDDDLRLSNGVLGVTKGPAPAAADMAFPGGRPASGCSSRGVGARVHGAATSSQEDGGVGGVLRDGGAGEDEGGGRNGDASAVGDGRELGATSGGEEGVVEGAVAGGKAEGGGGGGAPRARRDGRPTWLLDSPRLQDWVEADDFFVKCEPA